MGETIVAAKAISRGRWPRFSLPLCCTSDGDDTTLHPAARGHATGQRRERSEACSADGDAQERIGPLERPFRPHKLRIVSLSRKLESSLTSLFVLSKSKHRL